MQRWNYLSTPSERPAVLTELGWMSLHWLIYLAAPRRFAPLDYYRLHPPDCLVACARVQVQV